MTGLPVFFLKVSGCAALALGGALLHASAKSNSMSAAAFIFGSILIAIGAAIATLPESAP